MTPPQPVPGAPGPPPGSGPYAQLGSGPYPEPGAGSHPQPHLFLERLSAVPVVAILRAADAGRFLEVGRVLYEEGVRAVEVTLTSEGALEAFGRLRGE
ncbi:MAG: aldolase, partial [Actinomycetia bacterium]|nr:aldolase [Actinomycetes bacterium]